MAKVRVFRCVFANCSNSFVIISKGVLFVKMSVFLSFYTGTRSSFVYS